MRHSWSRVSQGSRSSHSIAPRWPGKSWRGSGWMVAAWSASWNGFHDGSSPGDTAPSRNAATGTSRMAKRSWREANDLPTSHACPSTSTRATTQPSISLPRICVSTTSLPNRGSSSTCRSSRQKSVFPAECPWSMLPGVALIARPRPQDVQPAMEPQVQSLAGAGARNRIHYEQVADENDGPGDRSRWRDAAGGQNRGHLGLGGHGGYAAAKVRILPARSASSGSAAGAVESAIMQRTEAQSVSRIQPVRGILRPWNDMACD